MLGLKNKIFNIILKNGCKELGEKLFRNNLKYLNKINSKQIIQVLQFFINYFSFVFKISLKNKQNKNISFFLKNRVTTSLKNLRFFKTNNSSFEILQIKKKEIETFSFIHKKLLYFYRWD